MKPPEIDWDKIHEIIEKHKGEKWGLIPLLQEIQEYTGYIPPESIEPIAEALGAFRHFNYDHVYLRPASVEQARSVIDLLRALVEHYADRPNLLPDAHGLDAGSPEALRAAVAYVGGMTDRFALQQHARLLG